MKDSVHFFDVKNGRYVDMYVQDGILVIIER